MHPGRWLIALILTLLASAGMADEEKPADFSAGFKQLRALGLPELPAGTKWAIVPASSSESRGDGDLLGKMKGTGWLLPAAGAGSPQRLVLAGDISVTDFDPAAQSAAESPGLLGRMLGGGAKKDSPAIAEADLTKDIQTLVAGLTKEADKVGRNSIDSFSEEQQTPLGQLLIFATQLDQTGHPELANQLASALFHLVPEREPVIDAAIELMASRAYDEATTSFFKTKDWKAYHREVVSLIAKYPRGWSSHGAVALLVDPLAHRASGNPPPGLKLDGVEIEAAAVQSVQWMAEESSAEGDAPAMDAEVAAQLASLPARYRAQYLRQLQGNHGDLSGEAGIWLLKKPGELAGKSGIAEPTLRLGINALPALAALIDDAFLTSHPNPGSVDHSYSSSDESPAEKVLSTYAEMNRPATRRDLARHLLLATLPDPEGELASADPETLRSVTLEFWKLHLTDSLEKLAIAFLTTGSSEQKDEAAKLLAASQNPDDQKFLEAAILENPSPASQIGTVKTYLQIRKAAAKPFLDLYVKALREEIGDGKLEDNRNLPWEIRSLGSIEPLVKQLQGLASGKSAQARAREIAKEDVETARTAIPALLASLSSSTPHARLLAMLAGASAAEEPEIRVIFLNSSFQTGGPQADESEQSEETPADRVIPAGEAKVWKTLLTDARTIPAGAFGSNTGFEGTLGELAAFAMEYSVNSQAYQTIQEATVITGKSLAALALPRANARLASQALPPLPEASKVSPARLAEIVASAATKAPLEVHPYLKTLTDDERAAWLKWFREPGDLAIPDNVKSLNRTVVERSASRGIFHDEPGTLGIDVGFVISKESLEKNLQRYSADVAGNSRSLVTLYNAPFPPGLQVQGIKIALPVQEPPATTNDDEEAPSTTHMAARFLSESVGEILADDSPKEATGVILASFYTSVRENRGNAVWWIIAGKPVPKTPEEVQKNLPDALADIAADQGRFQFQLQVLSRADAEALKKSE